MNIPSNKVSALFAKIMNNVSIPKAKSIIIALATMLTGGLIASMHKLTSKVTSTIKLSIMEHSHERERERISKDILALQDKKAECKETCDSELQKMELHIKTLESEKQKCVNALKDSEKTFEKNLEALDESVKLLANLNESLVKAGKPPLPM